MKISKLQLSNFGCIENLDCDFSGKRITVSGQNGLGKSTVKRAIQYILGSKDENGKEITGIRPHDENGVDIDGLTTTAELTVSVDGQENTLKRTCFQEKNRQGEYTGRDNLQYFIDDVKKGTKKAYDEFVSSFLPSMVCISAQEFLFKDTAGRRAMLEVFSEHDNDSIIDENAEFEPIRAKLKANTVADLKKACRDKIKKQEKERDSYPARIDEIEKQKVDIDVAELELQRNALQEQIAENKAKQEDISKQFAEFDKMTDGIMELKFELSDLERKANEELVKQKNELDKKSIDFLNEIDELEKKIQRDEIYISSSSHNCETFKKQIEGYRKEWKRTNELQFDESSLICPYCKQELPNDKADELRANFQKQKADDLERITAEGNSLSRTIKVQEKERGECQKRIDEWNKQLSEIKEKLSANDKARAELPVSIDISDREDVKAIKQQIAEKEQAMKKANSGAEIRQQLKYDCEELQSQLYGVERKIALAENNVKIDERVAELQKEQRELSHKIADVEKELDLLKSFERRKAELLEKDVNKNFEFVQFRMFEQMVSSDELRDVCQILVSGESYDRNLNFSNRLLAEVDICRGFQKKFDVQLPVILDNCESVNDFRLPDIENQLILLKCTDEPQLTIKSLE